MSERISCENCPNMILKKIYLQNNGLCGVCKRDLDFLIRAEEMSVLEKALSSQSHDRKIKLSKLRNLAINSVNPKYKECLSNPFSITHGLYQLKPIYPEYVEDNYFGIVKNEKTEFYKYRNQDCEGDGSELATIEFGCSASEVGPMPIVALPVPIVTTRLKEILLDQFSHFVRFVPVRTTFNGSDNSDFHIIVLKMHHKVWDLDSEFSRYTIIPGTNIIMNITNMRTLSNLSIGTPIFRNIDFSSMIVVNEQVKSLIESEFAEDFDFIGLNNWHD